MSTIEDAEKGFIPTDPPPSYELQQANSWTSQHIAMADNNAIELLLLGNPRAEDEPQRAENEHPRAENPGGENERLIAENPGGENEQPIAENPGGENKRLIAENERLIAECERRVAENERRIAENNHDFLQTPVERFIRNSRAAVLWVMLLSFFGCVWLTFLLIMASTAKGYLCEHMPKTVEIINNFPGTSMSLVCTGVWHMIRSVVYFVPSHGNAWVLLVWSYIFPACAGPIVATFINWTPVVCDAK